MRVREYQSKAWTSSENHWKSDEEEVEEAAEPGLEEAEEPPPRKLRVSTNVGGGTIQAQGAAGAHTESNCYFIIRVVQITSGEEEC